MNQAYDVLIVGGGPAGLSAGMAIGRMGRKALICDDGRPRNAPAKHMNNFPSSDGLNPGEWRAQVRQELGKYPTIEFFHGSVLELKKVENAFTGLLSDGHTVGIRKVVLAHGVLDPAPNIDGFKQLWGRSIFHCPFCHGFEVRNSALAVVAHGELAEHFVPLIYGLSKNLVLFLNGAEISKQFEKRLIAKDVKIYPDKIRSLHLDGENLSEVILENSSRIARSKIFWPTLPPFQMKVSLGEDLGCEKNDFGLYKLDQFGKTSVRGVFAGGDITTMAHSVINSASAGQLAGAAAVAEILAEDFTVNEIGI